MPGLLVAQMERPSAWVMRRPGLILRGKELLEKGMANPPRTCPGNLADWRSLVGYIHGG